jgi:hypothetical protein
MPKASRNGIYLFFSDDQKTIALVADSELPIDVREFTEAVAGWVETARANSDVLQEIVNDDGKGSKDGDGYH